MKHILFAAIGCALGASAAVLSIENAASQPRISTTRQLQIIGAAATHQNHGAWFVDLQSNTVIFCERVAAGTQCHTTAIP